MADTKKVKRTINGEKVELTPTENFIQRTGYRVQMIREQLRQLSKQHGPNYKYNKTHIDATKAELLNLIDSYLEQLYSPSAKATDGYDFAAKLKTV
jgi:hypothetical protein